MKKNDQDVHDARAHAGNKISKEEFEERYVPFIKDQVKLIHAQHQDLETKVVMGRALTAVENSLESDGLKASFAQAFKENINNLNSDELAVMMDLAQEKAKTIPDDKEKPTVPPVTAPVEPAAEASPAAAIETDRQHRQSVHLHNVYRHAVEADTYYHGSRVEMPDIVPDVAAAYYPPNFPKDLQPPAYSGPESPF